MLHHITVDRNILDLDLRDEASGTGTPAEVADICNEHPGGKKKGQQ
jgi:hypothetical protein